MLSGSNALFAGSEPSSFRNDLKKHLTELSLLLYPHKAQLFGSVSVLTALQSLELCPMTPGWCGPYLRDLKGQKFHFKLPHLLSLRLVHVRNGELVLSCPKLAKAHFQWTDFLRIEVEDAALECLVINDNGNFCFEGPGRHLDKLKSLSVKDCGNMVRHLTEDLGEMNCLQKLEYADFPQACMPRSFPQSLQEIELRPCDWFLDLPRGLKELHQLHSLQFDSDCESWEIRRPLAELLPVDKLWKLHLGCRAYDCTNPKAWQSETPGQVTSNTVC